MENNIRDVYGVLLLQTFSHSRPYAYGGFSMHVEYLYDIFIWENTPVYMS